MKLKTRFIFIVFILLVVIVVVTCIHRKSSPASHRPQNKIVVSTLKINQQNWQPIIQVVGNVKASKSILIASELSGIITDISFDSGQTVAKGQLLVKLRADSTEAALLKAEATRQNDLRNYQRRKALLPSHYISESDVDSAKTAVEKDQADVKQQQAILAQHSMVAPFSGVVGIRQVEIGQYLTVGQTVVNLESIDPVVVDFAIPEKSVNRIMIGEDVDILSDAYPGEVFSGKVVATSNAIDINSRSLQVRVSVPNSHKKLLSGMSVNVTVKEPSQNQIVVPQSALTYNPEGVGIYMLDSKQVAHWHPITVGERRNDGAVILQGLTSNDVIVIAGQQKLQEGTVVSVNNHDLIAG